MIFGDRQSTLGLPWPRMLIAAALWALAGAWPAEQVHAATASLGTAAPPVASVTAGRWQRHRVRFNCIDCRPSHELLLLQLTNLLTESGARLNSQVVVGGHGGLTYAILDYSTLRPSGAQDDEATTNTQGEWRPVRFRLNFGTMDQTRNFSCMLLYYFQRQLLQTFTARHIKADLPCESFVHIPSYSLAFEVFAPLRR